MTGVTVWTVRMPDDLADALRIEAARRRSSVTAIFIDAVRRELGLDPLVNPRPFVRWTAAEDAQLRTLYRQMPVEDLAAKLGRTPGSVNTHALHLGIQRRRQYAPGPQLSEALALARKQHEAGLTHRQALAIARRLDEQDATAKQIADALGVHYGTVRAWLRESSQNSTKQGDQQ